MSGIDDNFLKWYRNKDFTVLERMKKEVHREYYCRSAWFARDSEIETLKQACRELIEMGRVYSGDRIVKYDDGFNRYSESCSPKLARQTLNSPDVIKAIEIIGEQL